MRKVATSITDTSEGQISPYGARSRQGASIVPRRLFFVNEVENLDNNSRGANGDSGSSARLGQDKKPWKELDLSAITDQTN